MTESTFHAPSAPLSVSRFDDAGDAALGTTREWLLTSGIGGFAMGTASGVVGRRYHALLVAATNPPVGRVRALTSLDESILLPSDRGHERRFALSNHRFTDGSVKPDGARRLVRFERDRASVRWAFSFAGIEVVRELTLAHGGNACAMRYLVRGAPEGTLIAIQPRLALCDFHEVNENLSTAEFELRAHDRGFDVRRGELSMGLACSAGRVLEAPSVLPALQLVMESERGQPDVESLYSPGLFLIETSRGNSEIGFDIRAWLGSEEVDASACDPSREVVRLDGLRARAHEVSPGLAGGGLDGLIDASDAFLVERQVGERTLMTVLAGYPWFADWGRDTMIALPGLMLTTGRHEDARRCLETFAAHVNEGMVPNRFDDYGEPPHYNTADASLWFIHAACEYRRVSGDHMTFDQTLLPACLEIVDAYQTATRYGIRMDPEDGLITAGDETTQLTWMDAKRDGVVFTPRHGKAVEINALWHHGLRSIARAIKARDPRRAAFYDSLAQRTAASFREKFWRESDGWLTDCLRPDGRGGWEASDQIRPNQIFAVSLADSPLTGGQQEGVVACVRDHLLTPMGLRTLAPSDEPYQPRFEGDMMARDRAYHNGTVWPWLMGAYGEAVLRVGGFSPETRGQVRTLLGPLVASLGDGCLGQIAEVYDGEEPRRPQGCVAQAWSVAEVLRIAALVNDGAGESGRG